METYKLNKVEITLDGSDSVYQCGQSINGSVIINLNGELKLSHVSIILKCVAEVELYETVISIGYAGPAAFCCDKQKYLDIEFKIPDNIRNTVLRNGSHSIPFTFKLPFEGIPTSFEGFHGFIKYWIVLNINSDNQTSGKSVAFKEKKVFNVESPMRHNIHKGDPLDNHTLRNPDLQQHSYHFVGEIEKNIGFMFIGSGKVRIDANIRKKGHIPGEKLEVQCRVTNHSTVDVTPRISLSQIIIYMANTKHQTHEWISEPVIGNQVNAGITEEQTIAIDIPSDVSLSIKSRLISIKYYIHVTLDIPRERDIHLNLPIIITNKFAFDNNPSIM